jgi:3-phenylpropionate/trans-cinnamate dioxygenase ferredoxin subunit
MKITFSQNGPYQVDGASELELIGPDGSAVAFDGDTIYLCRCGGSTNKPFCDGTHSVIGFQGAMAAVERAEE